MKTIPIEWRDYIHRAIEKADIPNKNDGELHFIGHPLREYDAESLMLITQFMMCTAWDRQNDWAKHMEFMGLLRAKANATR